jgi:hypothetical protein
LAQSPADPSSGRTPCPFLRAMVSGRAHTRPNRFTFEGGSHDSIGQTCLTRLHPDLCTPADLRRYGDAVTDDEVVGRVGHVTMRIRGADKPGEVTVSLRGAAECFIAYSDDPIESSTEVLVVSSRGHRSVDVIAVD